jgi:hypothetical protein
MRMTRHITRMRIEDAGHYAPEEIAEILAGYAPFDRKARAQGVPMMGSGRVFPIDEDVLKVEAFNVPDTWPQIGGLDFGWDHPTAACRLAWDRDADVIYLTAVYAMREATPVIHAAALKSWGSWLPWAWPHDGLQHDKGSGETLADQYRRQGLAMLTDRATFEDGSSGLEAGVSEMLERMQTGRFKVFAHLEEWFGEFRLYHRKDGLIVKANDDRISAARYAMMMKRFARRKPKARGPTARGQPGSSGWMG